MSINILNDNYYYYNTPLGYGSFSIVFKGYNYTNNKVVAIKKITKIIDKKHFNNEINLMKSISHNNILKLYDVAYKTKKEIYFILEFCDGGDLSDYIDTELTQFDSKYFYEILDSLEYLYKKGILHRDIKPQNILINENSIKISDFGFAKTFEKNEIITTFCGSPLYMAPEIILNHEYNCYSDIWSLGVVLYQLITKKHPYDCTSREELWSKIKTREIDIDFTLIKSDNKKNLIKSLLKFDYTKRISWEDLFKSISSVRKRSLSFNSEYVIDKDAITQSVFIPKKINKMLTHSVCVNNKLKIINYDDCEVISNSAPNKIGSYYMNKYIKSKTGEENNIPVLGSHIPKNNSFVLSSYLTKSMSTIKGFFSN